jgi:zinc protease
VTAGETFDATPANLDARAQRFTLADGMKVVLLPKTTRGSTVQFALRLHYGDVNSIMGKDGDASLAAAMLMRGTTSHMRQEIEDTLDKLRADLSINGGQTSAYARGQTVRANLAPTLDLLAEILQHPAFPATELDTLKRANIAGIEQQRTDPSPIAKRTLSRYDNPYPPGDDRYTPTFDEEIATVRAPTVDSLKAFHAKFYGASAGEVAVVGDFDPAQVQAQLQTLFGSWSSPTPFTRVPQPLIVKHPAAMPIETPDKANAYMTGTTSFALRDTDTDFPALTLANYIFGGSTNSRLWNRIRQKEGLSYGINTSLGVSSFEQSGGLTFAAIFAPENLAKLRAGVADEMQRAARDGFTAEEVAQGKQALLQERRLARSQDAGLAVGLVEQSYVGRTFAFSADIDKALAALTPEQVTAAFRRYVKDDAFAFAFAGDFAKANKKASAP